MIDKLLILFGMWNLTDGWFSMSLYWHDSRQTFWHDHYIRCIRIIIGLALIAIGFMGV